jgi:transposase
MFTHQFYDLLLDLDDNWQVVNTTADYKALTVHLEIKYIGSAAMCPNTNELCPIYDRGPKRSWRHLDTMQYKTYIACSLPRVKNCKDKIVTIAPPWASKHERHTFVFEDAVIDLLQATKNQTKTAALMGCGFNIVNRIIHLSVERGMNRRPKDVCFTNLSLDEKSFKKGHQYASVLSSPLSGCIIDIEQGRDKQATKKLLERVVTPANRNSVETVSVDMWKAYLSSVEDIFPKAKVVHDRFHLVKYLNDAIDKVRRREVKQHEELKNSRFALLKNKENLTDKQQIIFDHIQAANYQVSKAWRVREDFKAIFGSQSISQAITLFIKWGASVLNTNIKEVIKVAKMFNNHIKGVCNALTESFSNAMAERLNGKIQEVKTIAKGYRTFKNFRSAILFFHGGLNLYPLK